MIIHQLHDKLFLNLKLSAIFYLGSTLRLSPDGPNYIIEQSRRFELECIFENMPSSATLSWIFVGNNTVG